LEFILLKLTDVIVVGLLSGLITFIAIGLFVSGLRKYRLTANWEYNLTRYISCAGIMSVIKLFSNDTGITVRISVAILFFGMLLSITAYVHSRFIKKT